MFHMENSNDLRGISVSKTECGIFRIGDSNKIWLRANMEGARSNAWGIVSSGHSAQDPLEENRSRNTKGSDYCVGQTDRCFCSLLQIRALIVIAWAGALNQDRDEIVLKTDPWISMLGSSLRDSHCAYGKRIVSISASHRMRRLPMTSRQSLTSRSSQKKRKSDKALFIFHCWRKREGKK